MEDLETGAARMEKAHIDVSMGASYISGITPEKGLSSKLSMQISPTGASGNTSVMNKRLEQWKQTNQ